MTEQINSDKAANEKCDLHIHSNFSDSDATIEEIFKIAKIKDLRTIAITDHDSVEGLHLAKELSTLYGIELIEAIEISAQHQNEEVHILGYFIDSENVKLRENLQNTKKLRQERLLAMIEKLKAIGVNLDKTEIQATIKNAVPTRLHLALYLVKKGMVKSLRQAFEKYLSPGRPAYVSRFKHSPAEAIEIIKSSGGLAFLAHPHLISEQSWIEEFIGYGLDGLEVIYPRFSEAKISLYKNMADKFGLLKSGGSDSHGSYREFTKIGDINIPYQWVLAMKEKLHSL
jgi:predicted metal-dependent phosphoesterase TrpH